jgi:hypothetical protein
VINLRAIHSDDDELEGTKMQGEHIRFATWHPGKRKFPMPLRIPLSTEARRRTRARGKAVS